VLEPGALEAAGVLAVAPGRLAAGVFAFGRTGLDPGCCGAALGSIVMAMGVSR
jgi:hypothetical protein